MLRGNTGLSKHSDPVFPQFCSLNQSLAHVGGGVVQCLQIRLLFMHEGPSFLPKHPIPC